MKPNQSLAKLTSDATLSQIVSADRQAGQLLASIGLDPSDHKNETLRAACQQRQWSEVEVLQWIKKHRSVANVSSEGNNPHSEPDFGTDLLKWINYIEDELLASNVELLDEISDDFPRVHQIHGNQYTWLKDIEWYVDQFEETLRIYCEFEKKKFFPLVRKLKGQKQEILDGTVRESERSITIIKEDQNQLQQYMNTIRNKSHNFENPPGACTSLRILNQNFKMLYAGLDKQFKIEDEILLPLVQKKLEIS